jgi:hypothetical protein
MPSPTTDLKSHKSISLKPLKLRENTKELQICLVNLITQIIDSTNTMEIAKKTLESNPQFDIYALFIHLDQESKGYLSFNNLKEYIVHTYAQRSLESLDYMDINYLFHMFRTKSSD